MRPLPLLTDLSPHPRLFSTPKPIIDSKGRIIAVLAGQPNHPEYRESVALAFQAICDAGDEARFPASMRKHRRGLFAAISVGLSYGKGQKTPCWLNNKQYDGIAEQLLANKHIKRMAGFADGAPPLRRLFDAQLLTSRPQLRSPYGHRVFTPTTATVM